MKKNIPKNDILYVIKKGVAGTTVLAETYNLWGQIAAKHYRQNCNYPAQQNVFEFYQTGALCPELVILNMLSQRIIYTECTALTVRNLFAIIKG